MLANHLQFHNNNKQFDTSFPKGENHETFRMMTFLLLMWGSFGTEEVIATGGVFKIAGSGFMDQKLCELPNFYGLPTNLPNSDPMPYAGNFSINFNASDTGGGSSFSSTKVLSVDITNSPIPEPVTMFLFD